MKTYYLYIKSHCEYPDFEGEVEAGNKKEAIKMFLKNLNQGTGDWDESMIENDVICQDCFDNHCLMIIKDYRQVCPHT